MKMECGCDFDDNNLPKEKGERVLTCRHGQWKFRAVQVITTNIIPSFTRAPKLETS